MQEHGGKDVRPGVRGITDEVSRYESPGEDETLKCRGIQLQLIQKSQHVRENQSQIYDWKRVGAYSVVQGEHELLIYFLNRSGSQSLELGIDTR